jgi:hypothetical protein
MTDIPQQLEDYPLIKLCGPDCRIGNHGDCQSPGKRPVSQNWQNKDNRILDIKRHLQSVGNYGVVPKLANDLVVIDSDSQTFSETVETTLPNTFTVKTGNGYHYYYRSDWSDNKRWNGAAEGEIKTVNSQVVGPGSQHSNGEFYTVDIDCDLTKITDSQLLTLIQELNDVQDVERRGSAARSAPRRPSPHSTSESLSFIRRDDLRQKVAGILRDTESSHNDRCWLAGWLYGAAGLSESEIVSLILREARWENLDEDIVESQVKSIIDSSKSSRGTHYSNYSPDDAGISGSSSRGETTRGKTMPSEWNTSKTVKNGSTVCRAGIEHIDPNKPDMESWDTVSLLFGNLEQDSEFGEIPEWENNQYGDQNTKQLGNRSASELRLAAEALETLAEHKESK